MNMDRRDFLKLSFGSVVAASMLGGGASFTYAKETNHKACIEWMGKRTMERDVRINCSIWDKNCSIWDIGFCYNKHSSLPKIGIEFVLKFFNKKTGG